MKPFTKSFVHRTIPLIFLVVSAGCNTVTAQRLYTPPVQPENKVARIWTGPGKPVQVTAVDGTKVKNPNVGTRVIEVLPGRHRVTVESNAGDKLEMEWIAEGGKDYEVYTVQKDFGARPDASGFHRAKPVIDAINIKTGLPKVK